MRINADSMPVSSLLGLGNDVYTVPPFQRPYAWGEDEWETLFNDLDQNDLGYFLGTCICINPGRLGTRKSQELVVVDGQQRLATLSLLSAALYKSLKAYEDDLNSDQNWWLGNLRNCLMFKNKNKQTQRFIPQTQSHNSSDYRDLLSNEVGLGSSFTTQPDKKNRRIYGAYKNFLKKIENKVENAKNPIEEIISFARKVSEIYIIRIETSTDIDAYKLFESLNNRGMRLTSADLIKNKMLAKLSAKNKRKMEDYVSEWDKLTENLGDDDKVQERFFRHYYNASHKSLTKVAFPSRKKTPQRATKASLIRIYQNLIDNDVENQMKKICEAGALYAKLMPITRSDIWNKESNTMIGQNLKKELEDLERIKGAPSYILLLHLLRIRKLKPKIVKQLICFFVRRNLTQLPPTSQLDALFMDIAEKVTSTSADSEIGKIIKDSLSKSLNDDKKELFQGKLEGNIYEDSKDVVNFILRTIQRKHPSRENVDSWAKNDKQKFIYTIEHILPQGDKIPNEWVKMLAGRNYSKAQNIQKEKMHKLGNLTLTAYNGSLSNMSFKKKRDLKQNGVYVGYKNNHWLNDDLKNEVEWNGDKIDERTKRLIQETLRIFT